MGVTKLKKSVNDYGSMGTCFYLFYSVFILYNAKHEKVFDKSGTEPKQEMKGNRMRRQEQILREKDCFQG